MPQLLTTGCTLTCTMGDAPCVFIADELPGKPVVTETFTAATIVEFVPIDNVPSFGMCSSLENPEVASATAAADGVLTPMPCVPALTDPWDPPSDVLTFNGVPLATVISKCLCDFGGVVGVDDPAEEIVITE